MITNTPRFGGTFTFTTGVKYPALPTKKCVATVATRGNTTTVTLKPANPRNYKSKLTYRHVEEKLDVAYLTQCKVGKKPCNYQGPLKNIAALVAQFTPSP